MNLNLKTEAVRVAESVGVTGLLSSQASFTAPPALNATGAASGAFSAVAGLQSLSCQKAPLSLITVGAALAKTVAYVEAKDLFNLVFDAIYPQLLDAAKKGWHVIIIGPGDPSPGNEYEVVGYEPSSLGAVSRLKVQRIRL